MTSGVYKISNIIDGRIYIGSSINIKERWLEHNRTLIKGSHHNIHLQRFVNKYGIEVLIFDVLEYCENHLEVEQNFIDFNNNLFNISTSATSPMLGKKHSDKTKKKISESSKGVSNGMYGRKRKQHVIDKMQEGRRKNGISKYEKLKRLVNLPNRKEIIINKNGIEIRCFSIYHASSIVGVSQQSISAATKSKTNKSKGWKISTTKHNLYTEEFCLRNIEKFDENCHPQRELIDMLKTL